MVTIAVVDDNPVDAEVLVGYLTLAAEAGDIPASAADLAIRTYPSGDAFLEEDSRRTDVVLLDIEMSPTNGIETARRIRARDGLPSVGSSPAHPVIVFVTNLFQFALEGYEVQALDFIVKPVRYQGFVSTMSRALQAVGRTRPQYVRLEFGRASSLVDVSSIVYVETQRKRLAVHTRSGVSSSACSMRAMAEKLEPHGFAAPHQSFLANLAFVERVGASEVVVAGEPLPLSRHRRAAFMSALTSYAGQVM